ncbi:centromere protein P [Erpetoichthys calabaricus]|uniref:centromere protein P n=1 Tax=Erpetoichthys calabaricus TaxID=27687 RepID=UPI002234492D|nr:centromere protein P [Erpetoichthys calabaricus]
MAHFHDDEIRALQKEIKVLHEQYDTEVLSEQYIFQGLHSFGRIPQESALYNDSKESLKQKMDCLEVCLSYNSKLNGVIFNDCQSMTIERSTVRTIQRHRISGVCHSMPFWVEFCLLQGKIESGVKPTVTALNILMDPAEFPEMCAFISKAEATASLFHFFRALSEYGEWYAHRKRTFKHFKEKYPDVIQLPEGCSGGHMACQHPTIPGFEMKFVWKINVTDNGVVTPKLSLLLKMSEQALKHSRMNVAQQAPSCFQSLLRLVGTEAAIEILIKHMCMDK